MKKHKKFPACKWLRDHSASTKPKATSRVKDASGYEYIGLDNGQIVHRHTARLKGSL